ncbi:IclR family transcriptional regulator [Photobacterium aquimaris]|uniref:IclR family transcriptional regulator n=1 Tax=Photobacterium aquimaris TaxID=512643 RepID=A0A2T3IFI6_9GAMM|nr:uracil-DNA glycosylase family protein [Photobacterium aquimaris]OBU15855.1 IclR family transcriptional regulator [Photobacterium aquimaris]OBU19935.1 IclR family transcriptional regulator [Photobacterium aquimaris]PSU24915.1 IclR family transcriptional regulator [Photobacterium aquimaris]PSV97468.1 IclR family transcriptional regulator [Photobacterium aquimaris]
MTTLHLSNILDRARRCKICHDLPLGPRPIIQAHQQAKLLIIGQAPGIKVHQSGIPWHDASGERLRRWLDLDNETFYDPTQIAIIPMGLCYPGKAKSGDLPPRKICAPHWHPQLLPQLPNIGMTLLIGQYAQQFYLSDKPTTLTATVAAWQQWAPRFIPLPHPSPRNSIWLKKNPWFEADVVPYIRHYVHQHLKKPLQLPLLKHP